LICYCCERVTLLRMIAVAFSMQTEHGIAVVTAHVFVLRVLYNGTASWSNKYNAHVEYGSTADSNPISDIASKRIKCNATIEYVRSHGSNCVMLILPRSMYNIMQRLRTGTPTESTTLL